MLRNTFIAMVATIATIADGTALHAESIGNRVVTYTNDNHPITNTAGDNKTVAKPTGADSLCRSRPEIHTCYAVKHDIKIKSSPTENSPYVFLKGLSGSSNTFTAKTGFVVDAIEERDGWVKFPIYMETTDGAEYGYIHRDALTIPYTEVTDWYNTGPTMEMTGGIEIESDGCYFMDEKMLCNNNIVIAPVYFEPVDIGGVLTPPRKGYVALCCIGHHLYPSYNLTYANLFDELDRMLDEPFDKIRSAETDDELTNAVEYALAFLDSTIAIFPGFILTPAERLIAPAAVNNIHWEAFCRHRQLQHDN